MTRSARLTLFSVLMVGVLVTTISALYLKNQIDRQFQFVLQRADLMKRLAADAVSRSIDQHLSLSIPEALAADADLPGRLLKILALSGSLLEIAVCDPQDKILFSTDLTRPAGLPFPKDYPDYARLAGEAGLLERLRVLSADTGPKYYQLSEALGAEGQAPVLWVRVVIYPALIRPDVIPDLRNAALGSLVSIVVSIVIALLFSRFAFRPLRRVTDMLDHLTRGDYAPPEPASLPPAREDEFGIMVSKVNLLGQQLGNFERLLDQLEEAVLIFGREGRLVVASGALERFLGRRRFELMGLAMSEIFPPDDPIGFFLEQMAETGRPVRNWKVKLRALAGGTASEALLSVEILESFSADSRKSAGLLVRLRDPEARRQIQGQLQTAERLSAITRVASGVAHEVKNPLNAMLMHVELARIKLARGDGDVSPQMEIIGGEILRLDRVVKTFLDFNRPMELKRRDLLIDKFVADMAELARPQAMAAGVSVVEDLRAAGATMYADLDLLKQALLNIVVNAIEAMPQGGQLTFASSLQGEEVEIR
ncbi:MAG: histidine kinase dimerization/phospho-acceptor domain-containing protein, partial [Bryobacteraceae bacterium]